MLESSVRLIALASLAVAVGFVPAGCGGRKVAVVNPDTSIHLSGRWKDDDSKTVSSQMIDQCLRDTWVTQFRDRAGRAPIVRVATVVNKSNEEIATQIFTDDLTRALQNSGKVRVVVSRDEAEISREERADLQAHSSEESKPQSKQEQAPDYLLTGAIRIQHDREGDNQVKYYQVDLRLVDVTTNEVAWPGSVERKKVVSN